MNMLISWYRVKGERNENSFVKDRLLFSDCLNVFAEGVFAAMSRFVSLSSQRCASGRLARSLRWLENECENESVCGMTEVRLSLDIAWAECIGCGCGDELAALAALSSLSEFNDTSEDQGKVKEIKGRALGCTAFFLLWGEKMALFEFLLKKNTDIKRGEYHFSSLEERLDISKNQSTKLLTQAAKIGNSFGLWNPSSCSDYRVSQNKKKAIKLLQESANMDDNNASFFLAVCYLQGGDVEQNKEKSIELFQRAAEMGNTDAMLSLGVCYDKGEDVSHDKKKAIGLYQQAADMGNMDATLNLALCFDKGEGVPQDKKKAIELFQRAADTGNTNAMLILGTCYLKGDGVAQYKKKAIELYQRAANMGDTKAMINLALCYLKGEGVPKDKKKAIELYQRATEMGNTDGMFNLGICYGEGDGVAQDKKKAFELQSTFL